MERRGDRKQDKVRIGREEEGKKRKESKRGDKETEEVGKERRCQKMFWIRGRR